MPESLTPWLNSETASSRSASLEAAGWRISTISTSLIELARPLDGAHADEQQREAEREAERDVGGAVPADDGRRSSRP